MEYIVAKKEMQDIDKYTIETVGIPAAVLMERAALTVASLVEEVNTAKGRVLVVVEGGNNGGDGLAVARILTGRGYDVDVYPIGAIKKPSKDYELQMDIMTKLGVAFCDSVPDREYSVIVDGIFGVGLSRDIEGLHKEIIGQLNCMKGIKVAIDMPSGIDSDTGDILGVAFKADYTVTFGFKKLGMFLSSGVSYCGEIICGDIGFPEAAVKAVEPKIFTYDREDLARLPKRQDNSHKGTYGRVAVIAGSKDMSGAAFLCAKAAYSVGTGLVKVYSHESNREILQSQLPEALMMTYDDSESAISCVQDAISWASVIVAGPGIGVNDISRDIVNELLTKADKPLVLDADALNIISKDINLLKGNTAILTPHMKEMSRLTGKSVEEIAGSRFETARKFASDINGVVVLKDAKTVVADRKPEMYINVCGNNGMSTGGSGDVLSGIIAGLLVYKGLTVREAAWLGTFIHGLAGDKAAEEKGRYAMLASDIINHIGDVMR